MPPEKKIQHAAKHMQDRRGDQRIGGVKHQHQQSNNYNARNMRLKVKSHCHVRENNTVGEYLTPEALTCILSRTYMLGKKQNYGNLGKFRGLEAERAYLQPAESAAAVIHSAGIAQHQHQRKEEAHADKAGQSQLLDPFIGEIGSDSHADEAEQRRKGLLLQKVKGIVIGIVGQCGDLAASLVKRKFDVKDYGTVFPGHGGFLDRIDSYLFVFAAMYILTEIVIKL